MECNRPGSGGLRRVRAQTYQTEWRPRECAMRLAFWRAGKDKPVVERAIAKPAPSAPPSPTCRHKAGRRKPVAANVPRLHRRSRSACARSGADPQAKLDHRPDGAGAGAVAGRGQHRSPPVTSPKRASWSMAAKTCSCGRTASATRSADPVDAEAVTSQVQLRAVARSGPRDHQEEQAGRAPGIRSGAAGLFAAASRCWRCSESAATRSR